MDKVKQFHDLIASAKNSAGLMLYRNLARTLLNHFDLTDGDPRIVFNYREDRNTFPLTINNRYILNYVVPDSVLAIIMEREIFETQSEFFKGWEKSNFDFKAGRSKIPSAPIWIWKKVEDEEKLSLELQDAWLFTVRNQLNAGKKSSNRKYHFPSLYEFVVGESKRNNLPMYYEEIIPSIGAGFGSSERNKEVEIAAIKYATSFFAKDGWEVISVEQDKVGYDLRCIKGEQEYHIEVKGISGPGQSFIITKNEIRIAKENPIWKIFIVTNALSMPEHTIVDGGNFDKEFDLDPISYFARKKNL